jgi:cholesterol oxidase
MGAGLTRRGFLGVAGVAAGGLAGAGWAGAVSEPPEYSPVLVVGSGFGAAVSALRLGEAGVRVSVLERGLRWPTSRWQEVFSPGFPPDSRAFWLAGLPPSPLLPGSPRLPLQRYAGVLETVDAGGFPVLCGAAVGGGSVVFYGAMTVPRREYFTRLYPSEVDYDSLVDVHLARARRMLRSSRTPEDLLGSAPWAHARVWRQQASKAGYAIVPVESAMSWDICRDELAGRARPSVTIGEASYGNSNGGKLSLTQTYIPAAEATGNVTVHPLHQVTAIARDSDRRYVVSVDVLNDTGSVVRRRTLVCDALVLGAGSMGSSGLLVRARDSGALPRLNEHVGQGWGSNGNSMDVRILTGLTGTRQAMPLTWGLHDTTTGVPTALVSGFVPGPLEAGLLSTISVAFDAEHRGSFHYDRARDTVALRYPANGEAAAAATFERIQQRIAAANPVLGLLPSPRIPAGGYTAHPLGGACLGKATDLFGRVAGYERLYVNDGALLPGNAGLAGPALSITALAERNIERIIAEDLR